LLLIYYVLAEKTVGMVGIPYFVMPVTFFLMWARILQFFIVFKPTRYLIKMIFEILQDMMTFLIILLAAMFAYA